MYRVRYFKGSKWHNIRRGFTYWDDALACGDRLHCIYKVIYES